MIPSGFDEANANFGAQDNTPIRAFREDGHIVTRWRPVRAEVEAFTQGASVWCHVWDKTLPHMALTPLNPFLGVIEAAGEGGGFVDPVDPLEMAEKCAAHDMIKELLGLTVEPPEAVIKKVAELVHFVRKVRKDGL